ncbi:MAG: HEAT repeat domain-containing protein [Planctomycetes bacterium]|nr:HEAT repeat domain-containing protein [Planctomycetota bacterium]
MRTLQTVVLTVLTLALLVPSFSAQNAKPEATPSTSSDSGYKVPESLAGKTLDEWIRELRSLDPSVKENVLRTLPLFGDKAAKAVPAVINLANLEGQDVSVRVNVCIALMSLNVPPGESKAAVRALVRRLTTDAQAVVRLHAAMALGQFEDAKEAIPGLLISIKDTGSWEIRRAAIAALAVAGKDKEKGPDPRATAALLDVLRLEHSSKVRLEAIMALASMGKSAAPQTKQRVIQVLKNELKARDRTFAVWAYVGLMKQDTLSKEYLGAVLTFLKDDDVPTRAHAAYSLGMLASELKKQLAEKDKKEVINALVNAAKGPETAVAEYARWSLGELGQAFNPSNTGNKGPDTIAGKTVQEWIKELKTSRDPSVKENVLRMLPLFGDKDKAAKAVPDIIEMAKLDREDVSLRVNACIALTTLEVPSHKKSDAVRALVKRLTSDTQAAVRLQAAMAVGYFKEDAKEAIPGLISSTKDTGSWEIRKAAINSLAQVGWGQTGPDPRATAALLDVLKRETCSKVRLEAVMALGSMGKAADQLTRRAVMVALKNELSERDRTIAVWAVVGLMVQDTLSKDYLNAVLKFLEKGNVPTRAHAAYALGMVASEAKKQLEAKDVKDLINALVKAAKDPDTSVAVEACYALGYLAQSFDPGKEATSILTELSNSKDRKLDRYVKDMATAALKSVNEGKWKAAQAPKSDKPGKSDKPKVP